MRLRNRAKFRRIMSTTKQDTNGTVTKTPSKASPRGYVEVEPSSIDEQPETRLKDEQRLATLESVIKKGWRLYVKLEGEIADALQEIKNRKLYRYGFKTWEKYCQHVLKITARSANRALNANEVRKIEANIRQAAIDNEQVATENRTRADFRDVTPREARALEGLDGTAKVEAVKELMQTPAPARIPRMPPPREVVPAEAPKPIATEPEVQKPVCPLDNDQLHWVVLEIENWYQLNKAAVNCVPPPTPMALVSKIQRHLQNLKR